MSSLKGTKGDQMERCERCGEERELVPGSVICGDCNRNILNKSTGKRYHPVEVAKKIDDLERRVSDIETTQKRIITMLHAIDNRTSGLQRIGPCRLPSAEVPDEIWETEAGKKVTEEATKIIDSIKNHQRKRRLQ